MPFFVYGSKYFKVCKMYLRPWKKMKTTSFAKKTAVFKTKVWIYLCVYGKSTADW